MAFVPNIALGRIAELARLTAASDALVAMMLKSAGLESDAVLKDVDDFAAMVAGTTNESTFAGYARQVLTGVTVTVDDTNDRVDVDCADPVFSPTASEGYGALVVVHDADTTAGTDSGLIPLHVDKAFAGTTSTSGTLTYQVPAGGFFRAA